MVAPGGRHELEGPLRSPVHSNVSPYRQDDVWNLSVDRHIRSPNKSQPKFRPVGASDRNYTETSRGVKPEWRYFEGRSSRPCWQKETSVSCHLIILMIQGNSSRLAETGRDRGQPRSRDPGASCVRTRASHSFHGSVTQTRESVYHGSVVSVEMPGRSGGLDRWAIDLRSRESRHRVRSRRTMRRALYPESETAAAVTGVYQIGIRNFKKPQQVVTEVSTRRGFRSELYPV